MPYIKDGREVLQWALWDATTLGAAAVSATLFQTPVSGSTTLDTTNMREAGKLPYPDTFEFQGMRMFFDPDLAVASVIALLKGTVSLVIGAKTYAELLMWRIPGAAGLYQASMANQALIEAAPNTFSASVIYGQNGMPTQNGLRTFSIPIKLEAGEVFRVDCAWPTAPGALKFWLAFDGLLRRTIQ